jgi:DNA primase
MPFPPHFLDELRQRVSLPDIVGRRVRLAKRGREHQGLCPFHNEKTPSFHVWDDHYHCFGCGAHGDAISFVMETGRLGFLEAVEQLAQSVGLEVPKTTPDERERFARQATLQQAMEAASAFFEQALASSQGREARAYLERRGLDAAAMKRFRLGFAPDARDALKRALEKEFAEAVLIEGGLARKPDDGGASYDYFRNRIMFPIGGRSGRVIAFGARAMGDGQPKYLNSPETPLFQKGRVLYGWAEARAAAAQEPSAIVTEGYMDVIALQRAGFGTAVAPLGTALTEAQLEEVWKLAPEPILCFDGDAAGQRAQARALDRALPLLRAGCSLRFAELPAGEDPDSLIQRQGPEAMQLVLQQARPLAEVLWSLETAHPADTPERRAALEKRLDERVRLIADRSVQQHYRDFFRERVFRAFGRRHGPVGGRITHRVKWERGRRGFLPPPDLTPPSRDPALLRRRQQEVALAVMLNHPRLLNEFAEELAALDFAARDLDSLRHEILEAHRRNPDLDGTMLKLHLSGKGFAGTVEGVLSPQVLLHACFARADADHDFARAGWLEARSRLEGRRLAAQVAEAGRDLAQEMTQERWARFYETLNEQGDEIGGGAL